MNFEQAFEKLLGHEGGFVDNPADPGGATRWGITERVARKNGYKGSMRDLPVELAKKIARAEYWDAVRADDCPAELRFDLFDGAYNSGPIQSIKWMQRAIRVNDDGVIGPKTFLALKMADGPRAAARYNGHRLKFMTDLKNWKVFGRGWAIRVANNLLDL